MDNKSPPEKIEIKTKQQIRLLSEILINSKKVK